MVRRQTRALINLDNLPDIFIEMAFTVLVLRRGCMRESRLMAARLTRNMYIVCYFGHLCALRTRVRRKAVLCTQSDTDGRSRTELGSHAVVICIDPRNMPSAIVQRCGEIFAKV